MNEQLQQAQEGLNPDALAAIRADWQRMEHGEFTWEEVQADLDHAKTSTLEADSSAFITDLADKISVHQEPATEIPGAPDEWIPGKTTYTFEYNDAKGDTVQEEVPAEVAERVKQHAAEQRQAAAAEAAATAKRNEFLGNVGKAVEDNPNRPDEAMRSLGLSQKDLREMGYTRFGELADEAKPVYEVQKAEAAKQAKLDREAARAAESKRAHEAAWAKNDAYAAELAKDQKIAEVGTLNAYKMSVSELSELTGLSQSEIHNKGKDYAIKMAEARIAERAAKSTQSVEDNLGVTRDTAAEERQNTYAQMLKNHDRAAGRKKITEAPTGEMYSDELPEALKPVVAARFNQAPVGDPSSTELPWQMQTIDTLPWNDADRSNVTRNVEATGTWAPPTPDKLKRSDEQYEREQIEKSLAGLVNGEPETERKRTWRERARNFFYGATANFVAPERREITRRGRIALIVGGAAAVGAGVLAWRAGAFDHMFGKSNIDASYNPKAPKGNGNLDQVAGALGGKAPKGGAASQENLDQVAGALGGRGGNTAANQEAIDAVNRSLQNRTNEILNAPGSTPWSKAHEMYGDQVNERLNQAVERLNAQGVDAHWVGTGQNAYIEINGASDTATVWNQLSGAMAQQDMDNFFNNVASSTLPATL